MAGCAAQEPAQIVRYAEAFVPTEYGRMRVLVYREEGLPQEHCAIAYGEVAGQEGLLTRVHSECFTGEVLHSLKCDCREQLQDALRQIAKEGRGMVLYLRQEGRGIGLGNKIRAYGLQEQGLDTVEANHILGFPDDLREYDVAAAMLRILGVKSVHLITNNPKKIKGLEKHKIVVNQRIPLQIEPNSINKFYLQTKAKKSGHLLNLAEGFSVA